MLDNDIRQKIVARLIKASQPDKIILFGSYCRGEQKPDSDIDLFIIKDTGKSPYKRSGEYRKALLDMGLSFDIIVRTPAEVQEWRSVKDSFIHTVLTEGNILYER